MTIYYDSNPSYNQIKGIPLFRDMPDDILSILQEVLEIHQYNQGQNVFLEGFDATTVYFIIEGTVQIVKTSNLSINENCLDELTAPEFFGEMALIDHGKRSATVVAVSNLITAELSYENCNKIFAEKPEVAAYLYKSLAHELSMRLRGLNSKYSCVCKDKNYPL